jgi:VirB8 protein
MLFKRADSKGPEGPQQDQGPEKLRYSTYYEQDGALKAYANRAMLLAFLCAPTALLAVGVTIYVLTRPTPVVRVDASGVASMLAQKAGATNTLTVFEGTGAAPNEIEKRAVVRAFLERYENFTAETVNRQWAEAINMMTSNLRRATLAEMQTENAVGKIQDEQITSVFHLRSIDPEKDDPLTFVVFGVKDIHRVDNHQEASDKLVLCYRIQLVPEKRSEQNPSGLLIARYSEQLIEGEKRDAILGASMAGMTN